MFNSSASVGAAIPAGFSHKAAGRQEFNVLLSSGNPIARSTDAPYAAARTAAQYR
jgi:hypothetical protein